MHVAWLHRYGPVLAEVAVLLALIVLDTVPVIMVGPPPGLLGQFAVGFGPVVAMLAVLRRRFYDQLTVLVASVIGLSAVVTALSMGSAPAVPNGTEAMAMALLAGAAARRLASRPATALSVLAGVAMVAGPLLRYGAAGQALTAAVLWGAGLAVGLILRDADNRRRAAIVEVRTGERLRLARELHDLVAQHITGVVVRTQAARRSAERKGGDTEPFGEIEAAGAEALAAMRRLVGMLRTDGADLFTPPSGLLAAIDRAVPDDGSVTLHVPDGLGEVGAPPEVVTTAHRLLTEALTNATRHSQATETTVTVALEPDWLLLDVVNDGARQQSRGDAGYGLVGMAERVSAVGGTVRAGREDGQRWRVSARLPLTKE